MEEADLFMECEEEELEPWQQMNQNESDDSLSTIESRTSSGAVAEVETPPVSTPVVISNMPPSTNNVNTVPLLTSTLPTAVPAGIPKGAPGQQLILTQGAGALAPVALSQVILPGTSAGSSAAGGQPIYFTTQGIPVQNIPSSQSPMGIVLNVQQGQTVRPITLVQASGTPGIFKPAVGATQIITQPAQMRPATPAVNRAQAPSSFTTVQIPATLTFRGTVPASQPRVQHAPSAVGAQPSTPPRVLPVNTGTQIVTVKPEGNLDVQNLMSIMNSVTLPAGGPPQTFVVMSNQKTNGAGSAAVQTAVPVAQNNTVPAASAASHICPRCSAQFKMIEALRGHMCFCCPDITRTVSTSNVALAAKPQVVQDKSLSVQIKNKNTDISSEEAQTKIVMLVDEFYYGTFEGNRVYVPTDNLKEPVLFKCYTCGKKLKNNIRLMNHMKIHMDVDQQTGDGTTHASCLHCYRQFPTPYRLQCHVESVHSGSESTSRCKICEWAFESEPVFLQHMKNTHKPGEMPYICQVCQYRSSFYSDVHNHFHTWHEDTHYLQCAYCLKVFKSSISYQQHFTRHQNSTVYHCNKCRLQFLFTKEKVEHKVNHHKTFRKPSQLEGLRAGTKVTIRAYSGQKKIAGQMPSKDSKDPTSTERNVSSALRVQGFSLYTHSAKGQKLLLPQSAGAGKKQIRKMYDFLAKFQEHRALLGRQKCVECTFDIPDFANHYPTYVHCSLCPYSTCCSRAYANHMINNHVPGRTHKTKRGSLSWLRLTCECCNYKTSQGDLMAKHLVQFPGHSYSTVTLKGNPKIGFVERNRQHLQPTVNASTFRSFSHGSSIDVTATSSEDTSREVEDLDQEMAPLDLSDSDLETDNSSQQETFKMEDEHKVSKTATNPNLPKTTKEREETLSVRQLRILLFALCSGIHKAAKEMDTKPQLIRAWLRDKEERLNDEALSTCSSGKAVEHLVQWVLAEREQQHPISEKNLFQKASEIHSQINPGGSFRISYEWAVNFMLQHKLSLHNFGMSSCQLPHSMEENSLHFSEFVHRQIKMHTIPLSAIGAMDELSVFVDFDALVGSSTSKEAVFRLEGTGKPCINIYLAVLADGTMLPTMIFFKGTPLENVSKDLPDSILLEARDEGFSEKEELALWTARIWQQHLRSQKRDKAVLVMDGHHDHMSEDFLSTISGTKTLPIIIPTGCTSKCQPLEMCVRPVLQKFLLARWSKLAEQGKIAEVKAKDIICLLVTWLEEALASCCGRAELIKYSFFISHVTAVRKECKKGSSARLALINTLTEAMFGTEAVDPEPLEEEQFTESHVDVTKTNKLCEESHSKEDVEEAERQIVNEIQAEARTTENNGTERPAQESMYKDSKASDAGLCD